MIHVEALGSVISDLLIVNFMLTNTRLLLNSYMILKVKKNATSSNNSSSRSSNSGSHVSRNNTSLQASIEKSTGTRLKFQTKKNTYSKSTFEIKLSVKDVSFEFKQQI